MGLKAGAAAIGLVNSQCSRTNEHGHESRGLQRSSQCRPQPAQPTAGAAHQQLRVATCNTISDVSEGPLRQGRQHRDTRK